MANKASGFITLHRQIKNWEWYRHPHTAFLFIHLLLSVNFVDGVKNGITIRRGQVLTSVHQLSTDTGLSIQTTKTALAHLRLTGEITDEANHQYRIITVVKYDYYQKLTDKSSNDQPTTNLRKHQRLTYESSNDQPQYNNNNNINKEINKQPNNNPSWSDEEDGPWNFFETFWLMYPKKVAKANAKKVWDKLEPDEVLADKIFTALEKWKTSYEWTKANGQYVPYPASWLNGRRWEDDIPGPSSPAPVAQAPAKKVVAQDYPQRSYESVDDYWKENMRRRIEVMRRNNNA